MRRATLLCAAMPFGYGPAAKLLTLAERLRRDWRLVFVGRGSALELVSREPDAFDEVVAADPGDEVSRSRMTGAWGVLSVMDRSAAEAATRAGTPLYVVDSLLWMRSEVPASLGRARVYFAQHLPGGPSGPAASRPLPVGPIVRSTPAPGAGRRAGLVLHLGGSAAPDERGPLYRAYARFVVEAALAAGLAERLGPVTVLGGAAALAALEGRSRDPRLRLVSAGHGEAREQMARAAAVLTAPGLTNALECFRDGTPTGFLPPQNYSQWCILRRFREQGVAGEAFHWEDFEGVPHVAERAAGPVRDGVVVETIGRLLREPGAAAALRERLAGTGLDGEALRAAQAAFFAGLGPSGAEAIATKLGRLRARAQTRPALSLNPTV